jgi:hypothetical protein
VPCCLSLARAACKPGEESPPVLLISCDARSVYAGLMPSEHRSHLVDSSAWRGGGGGGAGRPAPSGVGGRGMGMEGGIVRDSMMPPDGDGMLPAGMLPNNMHYSGNPQVHLNGGFGVAAASGGGFGGGASSWREPQFGAAPSASDGSNYWTEQEKQVKFVRHRPFPAHTALAPLVLPSACAFDWH